VPQFPSTKFEQSDHRAGMVNEHNHYLCQMKQWIKG
jgi:hypothetical protein